MTSYTQTYDVTSGLDYPTDPSAPSTAASSAPNDSSSQPGSAGATSQAGTGQGIGATTASSTWTPGSGPAYTQITATVTVAGVLSVGGSLTTDANGNYWVGPAVSVGPSLPVSVSVVTGSGPSTGSLSDFLEGWSVGWGVGFIYGLGGQWSNTAQGVQYSSEHGWYTPQAGINGGYNFCASRTGCHK